jgi:GNAT superfamily N-acetyltransferase
VRAVAAEWTDIPGWLVLAAEVEELFKARMSTDPAFERILERNVERGTALVVRGSENPLREAVLGAAIWNPAAREIAWLAVAERHRRTGVGSCLLRAIFGLAGPGPISVVTFGSETPAGRKARLFYEAAGFLYVGSGSNESAASRRDLFLRD